MDLEVAAKMARDLMEDYDFAHWSFRFDRAKMRHGQCHYGKQEITLSRHFAEMNPEALVRETILHEIAHAIVGPGCGHGPRWQMVARNLGVRPVARKASTMPEGKWQGSCRCGYAQVYRRHRRPSGIPQCPKCYSLIRWVLASEGPGRW